MSQTQLEDRRTAEARARYDRIAAIYDLLESPSVVASFVFCSVPDPVHGLRELRRVAKPDGGIFLLEHVRPPGLAGMLADVLNPLVVRLWGASINRRTVGNVERAGLVIERVENLWRNVVKLIVARPGK